MEDKKISKAEELIKREKANCGHLEDDVVIEYIALKAIEIAKEELLQELIEEIGNMEDQLSDLVEESCTPEESRYYCAKGDICISILNILKSKLKGE